MALTRKRVFILNFVVPFTLVLIVATGAVPPGAAAGVYLVIFTAFSMFGAAIPLRWDGQRGMAGRIVRAGVAPSSYLLQRAGAGAVLDTLQLTPALLLAGLAVGASGGTLATAVVALAVTVWIAGLVGIVIAAASRSLTETALFTAVTVPLLAQMSGVFREPAPGSYQAFFESGSPFSALHTALLEVTNGPAAGGGVGAVLWAVALPIAVALFGPRLHAALGRVNRGGLEGA
ncbi:MAG: hypothetical protein FJ207_03915 [Gemmatimonadetes bacterium]|nr:hypothetical protein [Gemmatimonadota bacterium]